MNVNSCFARYSHQNPSTGLIFCQFSLWRVLGKKFRERFLRILSILLYAFMILTISAANLIAQPYTPDSILTTIGSLSEMPVNLTNTKAKGYRGIWYRLGRDYEFGDKYSGGLGTYTANHKPIAIYAEAVNQTFFVVGGTPTEDQQYLLILAGAYDHAQHEVSRPTIVYDKGADGVYDAHDNAAITIDSDGFIWIFVAGRNVRRDGILMRSAEPYSVDSFEEIATLPGMTYPQPWFSKDTFYFFYTKYTRPRNLYFSSSNDGTSWSEEVQLARFGGHYQVSGIHPQSGRIGTFFNYHPESNVDRRTNVYYMESADGGISWTTVDNLPLTLPLTEIDNPALAVDYEIRGLLQYTSDLNWDADGNPMLLYVASPSYQPGPVSSPRMWHLTRWTGCEWSTSVITSTGHSYDMGSLHVRGNLWMVYIPSGDGPDRWGSGGEVEMWTSEDGGGNWILHETITNNSLFNHKYVRRPVDAHEAFFVLWADGDTRNESASNFYFTNSNGTKVWRLPYTMEEDWQTPEEIDFKGRIKK